ncbi:Amidohydrolase [Lachnospiraceae bacterium XBB1006]|nr:Amidohydrolase [Lachnospiraceae bacterium XBB1006]
MDWRKIKKIDAHVHILPPEMVRMYRESEPDNPWAHADIEEYLKRMEKYNIEKAVIVPNNDGRMYYPKAEDTNRWLGEIVKKYPDKFWAFADVRKEASYFMEDSPYVLEEAIQKYGLSGLKIHPNNLQLDIDSLEMVPVLRKAADLKVPVAIHSNPCRVGFHDNCAPDKINRMIQIFPDLTIITAHMGGMKWQDAITGCGYVDISAVLPEFVNLYGIEQTNRILRRFGADRLIFATDYPDVWFTKAEDIYEVYFDILNQMDFTEDEAAKIAYGNMQEIMRKL